MTVIQGSPEWFADRCGCVTASRISDIIAKTRTGLSASRVNYLAQLVAERLTGVVEPTFSSGAMQWGTDTEPLARAAYEIRTGEMVDQVGFILHPEIAFAGASPDGLINADGLVEIKCPNTATHIEYLRAGKVVEKYKPQMAWQMASTGRVWCDFVSYDPRLPERMQLFVVRYARDDEYIKGITDEVKKFLAEVDEAIKELELKVAA